MCDSFFQVSLARLTLSFLLHVLFLLSSSKSSFELKELIERTVQKERKEESNVIQPRLFLSS